MRRSPGGTASTPGPVARRGRRRAELHDCRCGPFCALVAGEGGRPDRSPPTMTLPRSRTARLVRLVAIVAGGVLAFVAVTLGPDWILVAVEEPLGRRLGLWGRGGLRAAYPGPAAAGPLLIAGSLPRLGLMGRPRAREAARRAFAGLSLGLSLTLGIALAELGATAYLN